VRIEAAGFVLRPFAPGDEGDLVRYGNDRAIWRNLTNAFPHPYTAADASAWVTVANQEPEHGRTFAIVCEGHVIGSVGFGRRVDLQTRNAEIGYWIGQPFWGRGIAPLALRLVAKHAFDHYDFVRLQAGILSWNAPSCRVAEKAGFSFEARLRQAAFKDGEVCDLLMYALLREP